MFILDQTNDKLHEECGVFGISGHEEAAAVTALGLHALQHRGQEAAGIVSWDGKHFHSEPASQRCSQKCLGMSFSNFAKIS